MKLEQNLNLDDAQRKWRARRRQPWTYVGKEDPQSLDFQESPEWEVFEWVQILAKKLSQIIKD